jgi:integrase
MAPERSPSAATTHGGCAIASARGVTATIKGSKAAAVRRLRELLKGAGEGAHVAPDKITVGDWVPKWLDLKVRSIEAQTHDRYEPGLDEEEAGTGIVLDESQFAVLVAAFKGHSIHPIIATAAFTGARKGEMPALRWIDVNLDARTISITRKVEEVKVRGGDGTGRKLSVE